MLNDNNTLYVFCKDLQNLIIITEEHIITPLRKEIIKIFQHSDILSLEIRDAEQISAICNADEENANIVLKEYPESELCFRCLGIDEDTIQGLLRIRGIGFLQLLDMTDKEVRTILKDYGDSDDEIDHVLAGLAKIRGNIDLIESDLTFEDDTRSFMKLVVQLSHESYPDHELNSIYPVSIEDGPNAARVPPLYVTGPENQPYINRNLSLRTSKLKCTENIFSIPNKCINFDYCKADVNASSDLKPINQNNIDINVSHGNTKNVLHLADHFSHNNKKTFYSSDKHQWNMSKLYNSTNIHDLNSSELDMYDYETGLSVPVTPIYSNKLCNSITLSPTSLHRTNCHTLPIDNAFSVSPTSRRTNCVRERDRHSRQAGTPPPKHRFKFYSLMHRSKSHESNLTNRIINTNQFNTLTNNQDINTSRQHLFDYNPASLDPLSNVYGDNFTPYENSSLRSTSTIQYPLYTDVISNANHISTTLHLNSAFEISQVHNVNVRTHDIGRHTPYEYHSPRNNLQLPALMTTSADGEHDVGVLNVPGNSGGTTFVISVSGRIHKFELESKIVDIVRGTPCAICNNRVRFRLQHCVHCKIKIHKNCISQSKKLPCTGPVSSNDAYDLKNSPNINRKVQLNAPNAQTNLRPAHSTPAFQGSDSNSASSCTSSTPGSPFNLISSLASFGSTRFDMGVLPVTMTTPMLSPPPWSVNSAYGHLNVSHISSPVSIHSYGGTSGTAQPYSPRHITLAGPVLCPNQFEFSSINNTLGDSLLSVNSFTSINTTALTTGSPKNVRSNGENHPLVSTVSSGESEHTMVNNAVQRFESVDSQDESSILVRANSISVTLKEWDIPMENLLIGEIIGRGTFGTVYRAKWHGEVAVKIIDFDPEDADESIRVEAFKREVALLHKTRHENLVLFMGACMKPPDLAIVTQLSQGETLFNLLHQRENTITINKIITVASEIAKGMGYLHAKGIVHRDLKTRNIFLEDSSRVVIGDFGVFNFVRLCKKSKWGNYLNVPPFWLCYVAPEIIHALNPNYILSVTTNELPLTTSSDIFAFGTVWYELLTNEYPFKGLPTEAVTYLVGRGIKQNLRICCPKDFKEILTQCWAFSPSRRPEFTTLVKLLDRLPKLHRSPSYPTKQYSGITSGSHGSLLV